MIEFYPQIKQAHIGLALLSGAWFLLRGAGALAGWAWPGWLAIRLVSYTIDTALLTAAMMLFTILPMALYANGWLLTKLVLVAAYVVLGMQTFRAGQGLKRRLAWYVAALASFAMAYSIARSHHPLGVFQGLIL